MTTTQWVVLLVGVAGLGVGSVVFGEYEQQRLAEEAVRNVAGEAEFYWVVEAPRPSRRSALWCGGIGRPDGLVAVTIRNPRRPFIQRVTEVAPAWVAFQSPQEVRMLEACWERVR